MKYQVLGIFKVTTSQGETELKAGQVITLSDDKAIRLISEGKITPIEKVAYKVYSEILNCYLWVVPDVQAKDNLKAEGTQETIYTIKEIEELNKADTETLKAVHKVKQVFTDAKVEDVKREDTL